MFESEWLSDKTAIFPVGSRHFMIYTEELPKELGRVWYRRIHYRDVKKNFRSARLQISLQSANCFAGVRLSVAHYKRCKFWNRLGGLGVFVRKIAAIAFTRNAATAGRQQSINDRDTCNTNK